MKLGLKFRNYAIKYVGQEIKAEIVNVFIPSDEAWPQLLEIFGAKSIEELFPDYLAFKYQLRDVYVREGEYEKDSIDGVDIVGKITVRWKEKRIIVYYLDGILLDDFADNSIRKRLSDSDRGKISSHELISGDRILKVFVYFPLILSNDLDKITKYLKNFHQFDMDYRRDTSTTLYFINLKDNISMEYMFYYEDYNEYAIQYHQERKGLSSLGIKGVPPKDLRNFIDGLTRLEGYWAILGYTESNEHDAPKHYFIDDPEDEHHWDIQDTLAQKFDDIYSEIAK